MLHPLTMFPELLTFGLLSPLLLRLAAGIFVIYLGWKRSKKEYFGASALYIVPGIMVVLGLYTQLGVIVSIGALKLDFYLDFYKNRMNVPIPRNEYILYSIVSIILISLLFTGPGFFAFDLPL